MRAAERRPPRWTSSPRGRNISPARSSPERCSRVSQPRHRRGIYTVSCMNVCVYEWIFLSVYMRMYVWMYECFYPSICVCMYKCMYVCIIVSSLVYFKRMKCMYCMYIMLCVYVCVYVCMYKEKLTLVPHPLNRSAWTFWGLTLIQSPYDEEITINVCMYVLCSNLQRGGPTLAWEGLLPLWAWYS